MLNISKSVRSTRRVHSLLFFEFRLARAEDFLPQIEASKAALISMDPRSVDIEDTEGDETVIQMSLGLGVFEDRTGKGPHSLSEEEGSGSDEDNSEEEDSETSSSILLATPFRPQLFDINRH